MSRRIISERKTIRCLALHLGNRKCLMNAIVAVVIVIAFLRVSQRKEGGVLITKAFAQLEPQRK